MNLQSCNAICAETSEDRVIHKTQRVGKFLLCIMPAFFVVPTWAQFPSAAAQQSWEKAEPVVAHWRDMDKSAHGSTEIRGEITAEIKAFLEQNKDSIWAYDAAATGFNSIQRNAEATEIIRRYVARFPGDKTLEHRIFFFFGNYGTVEDLRPLMSLYRDNDGYWTRLLQTSVRAADERDARIAVDNLLRVLPADHDQYGDTRDEVARQLMRGGMALETAERCARESVTISELGAPYEDHTADPKLRAFHRWKIPRTVHRVTLGMVLEKESRFTEALSEYQRAAKVVETEGVDPRTLYFHMGQVQEKLGKSHEALESYCKDMAWGEHPENSRSALEKLYPTLPGRDEKNRLLVQAKVNDLRLNRAEGDNGLLQAMDEELGPADLKDEKGLPIDLARYRGKLIVLDFWASWCAPCLISLQNTATLQRRYPDRMEVLAVDVDTLEDLTKAKHILQEKGYPFVLSYGADALQEKWAPATPARLLLDHRSRLRFAELGLTQNGDAAFEEQVTRLALESSQ